MSKYFKINPNLITLKCVLFFFFGGVGLLLPFLPLHMIRMGLNLDEARIISIVAPCVALLGPLIVGPLADKMAGNSGSGGNKQTQTGRYLRVMIAACFIFGAIFYLLLMSVPKVERFKARRPSVNFTCSDKGGEVLQERCTEERKCHHWDSERVGSLLLSNCRYACQASPETTASALNMSDETSTYIATGNEPSDVNIDEDENEGSSDGAVPFEVESNVKAQQQENRRKRQTLSDLEPPPHLCYREWSGIKFCQVYTDFSEQLSPNITLYDALNAEAEHEKWCRYPVGVDFSCRINPSVEQSLKILFNNTNCQPVIVCDVDDPYDAPNSVLAESQCLKTIGDPQLTFWLYLIIRSIADIFPTAAIALLDAAVVIATRETSTGRGDVGRQLAWGALGFAIFPPLIGLISEATTPPPFPSYSIAIIFFSIFMFIATVIILLSSQMPLSPPEWWWHTRSGMLALPMSAVRRYGLEIFALLGVLILLGIFWSTIDSYLPWLLTDLSGSETLIGLTLTLGALPAVPFLWNAEKVVDYCGHSNLLITAFTMYIVRYTGLSYITDPWWSLLFEALEVFTLALMWVTAILYLRHLVPRRFTVTGQASAVVAHFCLGRCIGAIIGGLFTYVGESKLEGYQTVYSWMARIAAGIAIIYFVVYHGFFKPRYTAPTTGPPRQPPTVTQGMNGSGANGTYTPLRVYHNERAKKGQFRY